MNNRGVVQNETSVLEVKRLSFWEGVALIVGTTIGAGILSMAYASRKAGYLPLLLWLVLVGVISTFSMLYVAECTLRTRGHHQLSGLAQRYLGRLGAWLIFCAVVVNTMGALTAYMGGSGRILSQLLGIDAWFGSLIFFVPALVVLWLGLKALGRAEKVIAFSMVLMILTLVLASLLYQTAQFTRLLEGEWFYMVPLFNVVVFSFQAQYIVPELARGFSHRPALLMPSIVIGMLATFVILALMPLSIILLTGIAGISDVATLAWGEALGQWAFYTANIFALCAMMTSYWGLGGSCLTNIFDKFRLGSERQPLWRTLVLLLIGIPPLLLAVFGAIGFVNALYFAGVFSGFLFAIVPIVMLRRARLYGDMRPPWQCGALLFHPLLQWGTVVIYSASVLYALCSLVGWMPRGW
jgi:amino acid permease